MEFYTLKGAVEKAKQRDKGTLFWVPCRSNIPVLTGAPYIWIMDPSGKKKEAYTNSNAVRVWITAKGQIQNSEGLDLSLMVKTLLRWEHRSDRMGIWFSDLTQEARERYMRFHGVLNEEDLNPDLAPIAITERQEKDT